MVDGRYTDAEWQSIVAALPAGAPHDGARVQLQRAAEQFASAQVDRKRMAGSAARRQQWADISERAGELLRLLDKIDHWDAPIWGSDGERDNSHGERAQAAGMLEEFVRHASTQVDDYKKHAERFSGKKDPDRERLYVEVLRVWTDYLGGELGVSSSRDGRYRGPLVRFFDAALLPILGAKRPKPRTIRGIVDREKSRRGGDRTIAPSSSTDAAEAR